MKKIRTVILGIAAILSLALVHGTLAKAAEESNINRNIRLNNGTEVSIDGNQITVSAVDGDNSKITGIYIDGNSFKKGGSVIEGTINEDGSRSYDISKDMQENREFYDVFGWTDTTYVVETRVVPDNATWIKESGYLYVNDSSEPLTFTATNGENAGNDRRLAGIVVNNVIEEGTRISDHTVQYTFPVGSKGFYFIYATDEDCVKLDLYCPDDALTTGSLLAPDGSSASRVSGLYGKTVDFGVAASGGKYEDAEYMFSWQKSGSGEWTNTEWQKDNWVHIPITEKGHYDFFVRMRYVNDEGFVATKSLYWADQYCGGTYFTFAQSGNQGIYSPEGCTLGSGGFFRGGCVFGTNAENVTFEVSRAAGSYSAENGWNITGNWTNVSSRKLNERFTGADGQNYWGNWFTDRIEAGGQIYYIRASYENESGVTETKDFIWWGDFK